MFSSSLRRRQEGQKLQLHSFRVLGGSVGLAGLTAVLFVLFLLLLGTVLAATLLWPTTSSAGALGGCAATPVPCCFPAGAGGTTFASERRFSFSGASGAAAGGRALGRKWTSSSTSSPGAPGSSAGASGGPELARDELEQDRRTGFLGDSSISWTSSCCASDAAASDSSGAVGMVVPSVLVKEPKEELEELDMRPPVMETSRFVSSCIS
mmetsp:Transcript_69002/g.152236  ORF Transcript_69002/g.152236 Transcript_69002/m.152236 type:complete len:209 (+) Transcript_69002:412-1038(+)